MRNRFSSYFKSVFLPCLAFSVTAGFLSAITITIFKWLAKVVMTLSTTAYGWVRVHPLSICFLVLGAAVVGLLASFILSHSRSCRGGGIPTSVAAVRGIVSFRWVAGVFVLPFSALLTFLCGVPLGTEGPCVQMGTAIGDAVVQTFGSKKNKGWRRYIMTGGASAGFSIATASPISAIIFSMEELHKHFSPLLLTVVSVSVLTAQITAQLLAFLGIGTVTLFDLPVIQAISPKLLFAPLLVGLICGGCSILFTRFYHLIDGWMHKILRKLPTKIVFPVLFGCVSVVGFLMADTLGTGHALVEKFSHTQTIWYVLIIVFLIRAIVMMVANTSGITGGIFLPMLTFGAIIGSLCAEGMIALGWIGSDAYLLMVVLGISSFLGSTSRIPLTACVFAVEALGGIHNVLPIVLATTVALVVVELSGLEDFTDTVIHAKVRSITKGKQPTVVEASLTVKPEAFVIGKELQDILWPNSCVVVSFERVEKNREKIGINEGDIITVHYTTFHPETTAEELNVLVGDQS